MATISESPILFSGAVDQTSIIGHGRSLLNALEVLQRDTPQRPIIFIVHSLGGLILKALRRAFCVQTYEEDLRAI